MARLPDWSPEEAIAVMDEVGIATSMLSVSSPGVHFGGDEQAAALARDVNEVGARLVSDHPGRFGLFASLPIPSVEFALGEVAYAFDQLGADGVVMLTNVQGVYLGDEALDPIFDELNRRRAVVFIHPTSPACFERTSLGYPRPMIEFLFDTTRAVVHLILSGTLKRCPDLKVIVPHCGGALPFVASRVDVMSRLIPEVTSQGIEPRRHLRDLYFDLAGFVTEGTLGGLLDLVAPTQLLYGSDWPFTPGPAIKPLADQLDGNPLIDETTRSAMHRDNALGLFPRLDRAQ